MPVRKNPEIELLIQKLDQEVARGGNEERMIRLIYEGNASISDSVKRKIRRRYQLPAYTTITKNLEKTEPDLPPNPSLGLFTGVRRQYGVDGLVNMLQGRPIESQPKEKPKKTRKKRK